MHKPSDKFILANPGGWVGGGGALIMAYTGRLQVFETERVVILLVDVYETVGTLLGDKKAQKGLQMHFLIVKKSRKRSGFVIYSYFKDSALIYSSKY